MNRPAAGSVVYCNDSLTVMAEHVTVIIVNYNAGEYLGRCIESLLSSDIPISIIVVDNASHDQSINQVMHLAAGDSRIKTLINSENLGYSKACNQGLKLVNSDYVCFINPDCEVHTDTMRHLVAALKHNANAALAGGWVTNPDGSTQRATWRRLPDARNSFFEFSGLGGRAGKTQAVDLSHREKPRETIAVEAVSGACMMFRHDQLRQLHGFDEAYFLHCEDLDLMQQISMRGWQVLLVPEASIMHHQGISSGDHPSEVLRHKHRGMACYYRKFHAENASFFTNIAVYAGIYFHLLFSLLKQRMGRHS